MRVFSLEPQIHGRLILERAACESGTDDFSFHRPGVTRVAHERRVRVRAIWQRIAPELVQAGLHRPAAACTIAEIDIRRGVAAERRLRAATTRQAVLELAGGEQLTQNPIGAIELADLAERTVGDEVDGILAVAHRQIDREPAARVGRIEGDELTTAVGLDGPSRLETAGVAQRADERRANERRVGDRQSLERARARAGGRHVAQVQLPDPAILPPHAGPGRVDVHATELSRSDALAQHFE